MISKEIIGYELVKDVKEAYGCERTGCDKLFAVRRSDDGDYLTNLVEVRENTYENYEALKEKYPFNDFIVWQGTVVYSLDGSDDVIEFYWS